MSAGDLIKTLPTDTQTVDRTEQLLLDDILQMKDSDLRNLLQTLREPILGGALFFFLSLPHVAEFIQNTIPYAKSSETSLLLCKTILFVAIFFVLKNYN